MTNKKTVYADYDNVRDMIRSTVSQAIAQGDDLKKLHIE